VPTKFQDLLIALLLKSSMMEIFYSLEAYTVKRNITAGIEESDLKTGWIK
jgi:hypothetical protein